VERVSVIIPTLNEVPVLGRLLAALAAQTHPPAEVIIADAGSTDGTGDLALAAGATVVVGPRAGPGAGRNDGARVATGDVLVFLDADTEPDPDFLSAALVEMDRRDLAVATCPMVGLSTNALNRAMADMANNYMLILETLSPRAPGWCILIRREVHDAIGGFDESARMAEDHDYVQRASAQGRFGVLRDVRIAVSMRRIEEEGFLQLAVKYAWCEAHAFAGRPVHHTPFEYRLGGHYSMGDTAARSRWRKQQRLLRLQLRRARRPILRLAISRRRP